MSVCPVGAKIFSTAWGSARPNLHGTMGAAPRSGRWCLSRYTERVCTPAGTRLLRSAHMGLRVGTPMRFRPVDIWLIDYPCNWTLARGEQRNGVIAPWVLLNHWARANLELMSLRVMGSEGDISCDFLWESKFSYVSTPRYMYCNTNETMWWRWAYLSALALF